MKINRNIHTTLRSQYNLLNNLATIPTPTLLHSALLFSALCVAILIPSTTQAMLRPTYYPAARTMLRSASDSTSRHFALGTNIQAPKRTLNTTLPALAKPSALTNTGSLTKPTTGMLTTANAFIHFYITKQSRSQTTKPVKESKLENGAEYSSDTSEELSFEEEEIKNIKQTILKSLIEYTPHLSELLKERHDINKHVHHLSYLLLLSQNAENDKIKNDAIFACLTELSQDHIFRSQNAALIRTRWMQAQHMRKHYRFFEQIMTLTKKLNWLSKRIQDETRK